MAIIIVCAIILYVVSLWFNHSSSRKIYVLLLSFIYVGLILSNQAYLMGMGLSFQPSDPQKYYDVAAGVSGYEELLRATYSESNSYYYAFNKIFIDATESPDVAAVLI